MRKRGGAFVLVAILVACGGSESSDTRDAAASGGTSSGGTGMGGAAGADAGCSGVPGGCGGQMACCDPKTGQQLGRICGSCGPCPPGAVEQPVCYAPGECGMFGVCPSGQFCEIPNGACSWKGKCQPGPTSCDVDAGDADAGNADAGDADAGDADAGAPACACDGYVRASECAVKVAGLALGDPSWCSFSCGTKTCTRGLEYCEFHPQDFALSVCKPLPPGCPLPTTCACLASEPCGSSCYPLDPRLTCNQ